MSEIATNSCPWHIHRSLSPLLQGYVIELVQNDDQLGFLKVSD